MNVREAAGACGVQSGANLGGVVAVIVDDGDSALHAANLETGCSTPLKSSQGFANGFDGNVEFETDRNRRRGVQHVMRAGNMQAKTAQIPPAKIDMKLARHVAAGTVRDARVDPRLRADSVSC